MLAFIGTVLRIRYRRAGIVFKATLFPMDISLSSMAGFLKRALWLDISPARTLLILPVFSTTGSPFMTPVSLSLGMTPLQWDTSSDRAATLFICISDKGWGGLVMEGVA